VIFARTERQRLHPRRTNGRCCGLHYAADDNTISKHVEVVFITLA
jgi:hypothetical protein